MDRARRQAASGLTILPVELASVCLVLVCSPTTATPQQLCDFKYTTNGNAITITACLGRDMLVIIPPDIAGLPVTSIGDYAFDQGLSSPIQVTVPDSVTNIGNFAFYQCGSLNSITLGSGLLNIGGGAFLLCSALPNISIPNSVTNIGAAAFYWCSDLTSITLPSSLINIGSGAFGDCVHLTSITIPKSVTSLGQGVFIDSGPSSVLFLGNAPYISKSPFADYTPTTYHLPGTTGWSNTFGGAPALLWNPTLKAPSVQSNQFSFEVTGTTNIPIVVEASAGLAGDNWFPLQAGALVNGSFRFTDPDWATHPARLYRVRFP
jgi:hypothetical protein